MGSVGANIGNAGEFGNRSYSSVNDTISNRINNVINDSAAMSGEQTIFIGERVRSNDTLLGNDQKKVLLKEVKEELKKRNLNKKISITTPRLGPNMYAQYLRIY